MPKVMETEVKYSAEVELSPFFSQRQLLVPADSKRIGSDSLTIFLTFIGDV